MKKSKTLKAIKLAYRPPGPITAPMAIEATIGVKFSQGIHILDEWWIIGGTKWSRFLLRCRNPIVYSKRGVKRLWRLVKRLFVKDPPMMPCRFEQVATITDDKWIRIATKTDE